MANALNSGPSNTLPVSTETPSSSTDKGKEQCKVINLRSGNKLPEVVAKKHKATEVNDTVEVEEVTPSPTANSEEAAQTTPKQPLPKLIPKRPPSSFPPRLKMAAQEKQFSKFLETLKQLQINIHLIEVLQQCLITLNS